LTQPNKIGNIPTTDQQVSGSTPDGCTTFGFGKKLAFKGVSPSFRTFFSGLLFGLLGVNFTSASDFMLLL
jgi:hypothetical protein